MKYEREFSSSTLYSNIKKRQKLKMIPKQKVLSINFVIVTLRDSNSLRERRSTIQQALISFLECSFRRIPCTQVRI